MHPNFRTRLLNHERLIGTLITLPSPEIAEMCADAGFDWLFLDMEHGALGRDDVRHIIQAVGERCPCVVRVPFNERVWITQVLDVGVAGIIVPQVNSASEAERAASQSKYPPRGTRSVGLGRATGYGARFADYVHDSNDATALIFQIEHIEAVKNVEPLAAVSGVDAFLIGPFDLSASMGKPGQVGDPDVQAAIARVREVMSARHIPLGIFSATVDGGKNLLATGFNFVAVAQDTLYFNDAVKRAVQALKAKEN